MQKRVKLLQYILDQCVCMCFHSHPNGVLTCCAEAPSGSPFAGHQKWGNPFFYSSISGLDTFFFFSCPLLFAGVQFCDVGAGNFTFTWPAQILGWTTFLTIHQINELIFISSISFDRSSVLGSNLVKCSGSELVHSLAWHHKLGCNIMYFLW